MTGSSTAASTEASASATGRQGVFHGWKVAGAGMILQALNVSLVLQAFGSYAVVLRDQFGWSKTTISIAYAFNRAESGLLGPLHGWALNRFGSRRVMQVGSITLTIGFIWFSQINTAVEFVLSFFVVAVGAGLTGFMTITTEAVKWFERKRARALSMIQLGMAAGGLMTPLIVLSLLHLGWRATALLSGLVMGVGTMWLSLLFGSSPAARGEPVDGVAPPPTSPAAAPAATGGTVAADAGTIVDDVRHRHLTAAEAMRTSAFWLLAFGHMSALLVVGSVIAHLPLYLTTEQGFDLQRASFVAAGIPIAQIAGMLIVSLVGDRMSKRLLCSLAMSGHVFGLLFVTFASRAWMVWAFVVLHGLGWGIRGPLMSAIRADYFGSTNFGQIMGYSSVILMFGGVGGPLLAGIIAEVTGSYRAGFTVVALLAATGGLLFALARPPASKRAVAHGGEV